MTIAQSLDDKEVDYKWLYTEIASGNIIHKLEKRVTYTFKDESKAYILTTMVECAPYIAGTTTTMSKRPVYRWKIYADN